MVEPVTEFMLEAPAGLIGIRAECHNGKVTQVTFKNVPAFAEYLDAEIDVPHLGKVKVDVAWGGMYYVIADVRQFKGLELKPEMGREITRVSSLILRAAQDLLPVHHPDYPMSVLPFLSYLVRRRIRMQTGRTLLRLQVVLWTSTILRLGLAHWIAAPAVPERVPRWLRSMLRVNSSLTRSSVTKACLVLSTPVS